MESLAFNMIDEHSGAAEELATVEKGLMSYNQAHLGAINYRKLAIVVKNRRGDLIGGLIGSTLCGWLYLITLWVADEYRHRGIGKKLMALAEEKDGAAVAIMYDWKLLRHRLQTFT